MAATSQGNDENTLMSAPEQYWNAAGEVGYSEAMYASSVIARALNAHIRSMLLEASKALDLNEQSTVLELGCGDGEMANQFLSQHFKSVEGHDLAPAAIRRATQLRKPNTDFFCSDITTLKFEPGRWWNAVFLIGILHHVKAATPLIIQRLADVTDNVVVVEPNGNHLGRRLLECLPSYRRAGEDSFGRAELERLFVQNGFVGRYFKRFNIFPNRTPGGFYPILRRVEPMIERSSMLDFLCTAQVFGFKKETVKGLTAL